MKLYHGIIKLEKKNHQAQALSQHFHLNPLNPTFPCTSPDIFLILEVDKISNVDIWVLGTPKYSYRGFLSPGLGVKWDVSYALKIDISCKSMEHALPLRAFCSSWGCASRRDFPGDVEYLWDLGKSPFKDRYEKRFFNFLYF